MSCLNADNLKPVDQCSARDGYKIILIACGKLLRSGYPIKGHNHLYSTVVVYVEQNASILSSGSNALCGHIG